MTLDVPTLLVVLAVMSQMAALSLVTNWIQRKPERHILYWALGLQLGAFSCVLLFLRGQIPNWLSIGLGNSCSLIALGLAWNGARAFNGRAARWWPVFVAPAVWGIALQVPAIGDSLANRIALGSVLSGILSLELAWEIWANGKDRLVWRAPFACVPAAHAAFLLFRMIAALSWDLPQDLLHGGVFIGLGILEPILMMFAATIIGLRLTDERLKNLLRRAALTDGLTGLLNHGAFMDIARDRAERGGNEGDEVTLLLFDLDRFKQLNDRYGHAAGDAALKCFSTLVQQHVAEVDFVGRVGGEEFAALLVGCGAERGRQVAERIRADFAGDPIHHAGQRIPVTVSVGVITATGRTVDFERLMVAADEALYAAKRGGRDLVFQVAS
ncbi:MAG: GGDEF domain-containing protein [Candidatus Kaistia colombiensis]|nr:MAG: GGDEF domain-containing protein [Kaistia sp.]